MRKVCSVRVEDVFAPAGSPLQSLGYGHNWKRSEQTELGNKKHSQGVGTGIGREGCSL